MRTRTKPTMMNRATILTLCCVAGLTVGGCRKSNPTDHVRRATEYFDGGKFREAAVELRAALQLDPKLGEARLKLADTYVKLNEGGNAVREYARAADLLPQNVQAQVKAGGMLLLARRFEDAKTRAE